MPYMELGPAYGRDYKNQAQVKADWEADKDFTVYEGGPYGVKTNRADIKRMIERGEDLKITIRYDRQLKTMAVNT